MQMAEKAVNTTVEARALRRMIDFLIGLPPGEYERRAAHTSRLTRLSGVDAGALLPHTDIDLLLRFAPRP
jgi:hypothetical protein